MNVSKNEHICQLAFSSIAATDFLWLLVVVVVVAVVCLFQAK